MKTPRSIGIHDGAFHADEVTACALLIVFDLADEDKIVRTRNQELLDRCEYVCDVGGVYDPQLKLFDHHQASYRGDLSSAGMVLLYLKESKVINNEEYIFFNHSMILGVDAHDNGKAMQEVGYCSFSHVVANFNPVNYAAKSEELDHDFFEALRFTIGHLRRLHQRYHYNLQCREIVKHEMDEHTICLMFERTIPWLENFFALNGKRHSALFIIMPAGEHWKLRGIPPDYARRMEVRLPLPKEWAGLLEDDLKKASGIQGAIFCHKGRFTSVWERREDAIMALKYVLDKNGIAYENNF